MKTTRCRGMLLSGLAAVMGGWSVGVEGAPPPTSPVRPGGGGQSAPAAPSFETVARAELDRDLGRLATEKPAAVKKDLDTLFDLYLAYGAIDQDPGTLTEISAARRLAEQLAVAKNDAGRRCVAFLSANPETARTLALAMLPEDNAVGAYGVLEKLKDKYPELTKDGAGNADLVAAMCVVYDKPPKHPVMSKQPSVDYLALFEYFASNKARLAFGGRLPVALLVHVVDVHSTIDELNWAQKNYLGNQNVGKVYSSIVYDTPVLKYGAEKKIVKEGYTLPGIKKVGGICTEQAFFASEVAKAIGVPSVYDTGDAADIGHAWVGYLKMAGQGRYAWDFSEGRFGDYKQLLGTVADPQTGKETSDAMVGLTDWVMASPRAAVRGAVAKTDAAVRLQEVAEKKVAWPPAWPTGETWGEKPKGEARAATSESALGMLKGALALCAGYAPAWERMGVWAEKGVMTMADKKVWAEGVLKMAGRDRPDFAFAMVSPMIKSIEDEREQCRMWDWAAQQFNRRTDLVSAAKLAEAECYEKHGDNARAWDSYKEVITRFANDGRSMLLALYRAEKLLKATGKEGSILGMYEDAFRRTSKPPQMSPGFETASNWFRVGFRYAELLAEAGREVDSKRVRKMIGLDEQQQGPTKRG